MRQDWDRASHLCVASKCKYGKTTTIDGYIISSVGEWYPGRPMDDGMCEIGYGRFYETIVFKWDDEFCTEADCDCGVPVISELCELDAMSSNDRETTDLNHELMVARWLEMKA